MQKLYNIKVNANLSISMFNLLNFMIVLKLCYPIRALFGRWDDYIFLAVYAIWLLISIIMSPKFFITLFRKTWLYVFFLVVFLVRSLIAGRMQIDFYSPLSHLISLLNLFIFYSIYLHMRNFTCFYKSKCLKTFFLTTMITMVLSALYVMFIDKYAIRSSGSNNLFGVMNFSFVYAMPLIGVIITAMFLSLRIKNMFVLFMLYAVLFLFTIINAGFMTALILFFAAVILLIITHKKKLLISMIIFCTFILLVFILRNQVGSLIISIGKVGLFNDVINNKISAVGYFLQGADVGFLDTIDNRIELFMTSWGTFIKNPFFGVDYKYYSNFTIGNHMQFFDDLARYGILLGAVYFVFIISIIKTTMADAKNNLDKSCIMTGWLTFLILGFLNPNLMAPFLLILLCFIPFVSSSKYFKGVKVKLYKP